MVISQTQIRHFGTKTFIYKMHTGILYNLNTIDQVSQNSKAWAAMAEFEKDLQCFKPSIPFSEMINQFIQPNTSMMGNFNFTDSTVDNFLGYQQSENHAAGLLAHDLPGTSYSNCLNELPTVHTITSTRHVFHESKKRKVMELSTSSSESIPSTASRELKDNSNSAKKNVRFIFFIWFTALSNKLWTLCHSME
jgi:hypothetical protein